MRESKIILKCRDVHKKFFVNREDPVGLHVLKGINLEIFRGEIVSIIGASGAGKSTLLHILGGLDKGTQGEVFWGDQNIADLGDEKLSSLRTKQIGFVFQFHHLLSEFTTLENVAIPQLILGNSFSKSLENAGKFLGLVGMTDRSEHKPGELSGGEQQRVGIARAIVNNPAVVFADEPTGNLDTQTATELMLLIKELNKSLDQTFIIATHNEKLAETSDRVFRIQDGIITAI